MRNERLSLIRVGLNLLIMIAVSVSFYFTYTGGGDVLLATGISCLKYFTMLSNIFVMLAAVLWIIRHNTGKLVKLTSLLKFISTVSVALTFTTVIIFLGPLFGYPMMFTGPNLWYHLIVPLAAMLETVLFEEKLPSLKHCLISIIPLLLYGTAYMVNILVNGVGESPNKNDWYGFTTWGIPVGIMIFVALCFITFGLACGLRMLNIKLCLTRRRDSSSVS